MRKITVILEDNDYLKIIKFKTKLQKENPDKNINFTDAVKEVVKKGLR